MGYISQYRLGWLEQAKDWMAFLLPADRIAVWKESTMSEIEQIAKVWMTGYGVEA